LNGKIRSLLAWYQHIGSFMSVADWVGK
jgi:hypothetical protein